MLGIDVSAYQPVIDWAKVKEAGYNFAYIKATEGATLRQAHAFTQAEGAKAVGLPIGYYHFANTAKPAEEQAMFFHSVTSALPEPALIPVLDIETNAGKLDATDIEQWILDFEKALLSNAHKQLMLYSYAAFLNQNLPQPHNLWRIPLWLAQYTTAQIPKLPLGWHDFTLWQFTGNGMVAGVGKCDISRATTLPFMD